MGTKEMLATVELPQRVILAVEHWERKFVVARHGGAFIIVVVGDMVGQ